MFVLSLEKSGRPHYPMEIQENVMTPPYKTTSFFVNMNFILMESHKWQLRYWQFLQL